MQDTDLAQLETFDYFVKIYEVRMELFGQFLMGSHVSTILKPCDPLDLQALISLTLGIYFCAICTLNFHYYILILFFVST